MNTSARKTAKLVVSGNSTSKTSPWVTNSHAAPATSAAASAAPEPSDTRPPSAGTNTIIAEAMATEARSSTASAQFGR